MNNQHSRAKYVPPLYTYINPVAIDLSFLTNHYPWLKRQKKKTLFLVPMHVELLNRLVYRICYIFLWRMDTLRMWSPTPLNINACNSLPNQRSERCLVYLRLPWIGNASMQLLEQIKSSVSRCFNSVKLRVVLKSNELFPFNLKDSVTFFQKNFSHLPVYM